MALAFLAAPLLSSCLSCNDCMRGVKKKPVAKVEVKEEKVVPPPVREEEPPAPYVQVYLENSGSIDGYVEGESQFKAAVYSYLHDLRAREAARALSLNYINKAVLPQHENLQSFVQHLSKEDFRANGGDRKETDFVDLFSYVNGVSHGDTVSLLITDCVFSPGRGVDVKAFHAHQQAGLTKVFAKSLERNPRFTAVVCQLESRFDGVYYNRINQKQTINEIRPYYMWLIGDCRSVLQVLRKMRGAEIKGGGVKHSYAFVPSGEPVDFCVQPIADKGDYSVAATHEIKLAAEQKGAIEFSVEANFADVL